MYDHWLKDRRVRITPEEYKEFRKGPSQYFSRPRLFYESGDEVQMVELEDPEILPTFFDLNKVQKLFTGDDVDIDIGDEFNHISYNRATTVPCYLYPLCFTGKYGNFQSRGPMHSMKGPINTMNSSLGGKVLQAGGMQGYLFEAHRFRAKGSQYQESTKGLGTGYFAGVFRKGAVAETKWKKIKADLEIDLPHQRFAKTIKDHHPQFNRQRLEVVWHVSIDKLKRAQQTMS